MLMAMLMAAALAQGDEPLEFRFTTGCVTIGAQATQEIQALRAKSDLPTETRDRIDHNAAMFARITDRAKAASGEAAIREGLSIEEQGRQAREQDNVFNSVPGELKRAMIDSCVYRFSPEDFNL